MRVRHPMYVKGDICRTVECGNKANPETLFCYDCIPVQKEPHMVIRVLMVPCVLLARLLGL